MTVTPAALRPRRRRLAIRFAAFIRWLHIYVSMFGLVAVFAGIWIATTGARPQVTAASR